MAYLALRVHNKLFNTVDAMRWLHILFIQKINPQDDNNSRTYKRARQSNCLFFLVFNQLIDLNLINYYDLIIIPTKILHPLHNSHSPDPIN
jgi:hypothetical protein